MALETPSEHKEWTMPNSESQEAEQSQDTETIAFEGKVSELANRLNYIKNGHSLKERSSNSSAETNQEVRDRLFAEATLEYYKTLSSSDDVRESFDKLRSVYLEKLRGHKEAESWFYNTAEKEIVKAALEELGYQVEMLAPAEMRDFAVDYAINHNGQRTYVSIMHQVPVIEFPDRNIVYSDKTEDFGSLFTTESIDTGTIRNVHRQEHDAEEKRKTMASEFNRISGAHHDLYAVEMAQDSTGEPPKSAGLIITLPNTRERDVFRDKKKWQPDPSEELEINAGFVDWREMEPGAHLRSALRRSLGEAREKMAA